ncbi:hypothetical protein SNK04_009601 [Fusarium graminearum]
MLMLQNSRLKPGQVSLATSTIYIPRLSVLDSALLSVDPSQPLLKVPLLLAIDQSPMAKLSHSHNSRFSALLLTSGDMHPCLVIPLFPSINITNHA